MNVLKVIHRGRPTEIKGVFSGAFVTSTLALNLVHASQGMFHIYPLPQGLSAFGRLACLTPLDAQRLLRMNTERAPAGGCRAVRLQGTAPTGCGGKLGAVS